VVRSDVADLLAPQNLLPLPDPDFVEMGVKRIRIVELPVLDPGMANHDDITPADMDIAGNDDHAIGNAPDGQSKSLGTSPIGDPVFAQMASCAKSPGFGEALSLRRIHGKIKPVRGSGGIG